MNAELLSILQAQAEQNEIRGKDLVDLLNWVDETNLRSGIVENIENGFFEVIAMNDNGPSFKITPAGEKYVREMPNVP